MKTKVVIAVDEKGLKLLKAVGIEFIELWRDEAAPTYAVMIPPVGGVEKGKRKKLVMWGRGGFIRVLKTPPEAEKSYAARATRITMVYLKDNSLSQVDRGTLAKHISTKIGWKTPATHPIREALDAGYLGVVK